MGTALLAWLIGGGGLGTLLGLVDPIQKTNKVSRDRFRAAQILYSHRNALTADEKQFAEDLWNRIKPSEAHMIDLRRGV